MAHIGNLLKQAIAVSGFSQAAIADKLGKGKNTIQRWLSTPNLGLKEVREIQEAVPNLYLKSVYDELEKALGHEIPDNPYRRSSTAENQQSSDRGIRVMLDAQQYAGYRIPEDFIDRVRVVLEDAQNEEYLSKKSRKK